MLPFFRYKRPGESVTSEDWNQLVELVNTFQTPAGTEETNVTPSIMGPTTFNQIPREIWASVTANEEGVTAANYPPNYIFQEVNCQLDGTATDEGRDSGGVVGVLPNLPANEIEGRGDVPTGYIAKMTPSPFGEFFNFKYNPPAIVTQCVNDTLSSYGPVITGVPAAIPLLSCEVNLPQDKEVRTYLVIAEVDCYAVLGSALFTGAGQSLLRSMNVTLQVGTAKYDTGSGTWPGITGGNTILDRQVFVYGASEYSDLGFGSSFFSYGAAYGNVCVTTLFDATNGFAPDDGVYPSPYVSLVMLQLSVSFSSGGTEATAADVCGVITNYASIKIVQVDKTALDPSNCGPVGDIDPPPPPPPPGSHIETINLSYSGGLLTEPLVVETSGTGPVVVDTRTVGKLPYSFMLTLADDTYTITATGSISGHAYTVTSGSFVMAGSDTSTNQVITY